VLVVGIRIVVFGLTSDASGSLPDVYVFAHGTFTAVAQLVVVVGILHLVDVFAGIFHHPESLFIHGHLEFRLFVCGLPLSTLIERISYLLAHLLELQIV